MYCKNGGECPTGEETLCECDDKYSGIHCEVEIDENTVNRTDIVQCGTEDMYCENGGECPTGTATACKCDEKHYGTHCELEADSDETEMEMNEEDMNEEDMENVVQCG